MATSTSDSAAATVMMLGTTCAAPASGVAALRRSLTARVASVATLPAHPFLQDELPDDSSMSTSMTIGAPGGIGGASGGGGGAAGGEKGG